MGYCFVSYMVGFVVLFFFVLVFLFVFFGCLFINCLFFTFSTALVLSIDHKILSRQRYWLQGPVCSNATSEFILIS